ncbi:putative zinc protease [Fusarium oxysporum f. sp. rapae]|uniref:Putative zinc protease n=1 Tax=Fusarium oxysporum f. sp. rapae TaxID=485398 RepID=A0A8J5PAN3_FUSOX|nr:putative zinc protease [Fusarium oxysporum f. sp. rapae]
MMLVADSLKKPSLNDRDYRVIRLNNEPEALRMHDSETDKASAALDINVENFSDESDISGTAHAVEHFFLMGTEKFSIENEYSQCLSANSGSSNAYTGPTSMNYFFYISVKPDNGQDPSDTNPSPLSGALDRFAQFFIEPLFLSETLDRENLYFPFIDEEFMFATQPSRYISHLIGHEGPGSIMSYTRSKGWANGLNAGAYPMCPGTPGIFDMQVRLTEDGLKNYPEIVKIFFPYIALLRENPPQDRFTSRISSVMQKTLPREWLLSGHSRLREFAPDQIEKALATIRPDNSCMVIVSQYRRDKIPDDLMQECKKAFAVSPQDRLPTLHLPHKNQFIPNEPEVEKQEMDEQALNPRVIRNDNIARTQWKKDDIFWVPRANVIVSLKTPLFYASAENNVKARLFLDLVRDALEMYSYDAELAGLQYKVSLDSRGLFLDVSGYNDKLPVLLDQIVTTMQDLDIKKYRLRLRGAGSGAFECHLEGIWLFQKQMLGQVFIEVEDRDIRTKTLIRGPAFDQLRTKEPFGYIVFSMPRTFSMTYGFRFLIQSEMAPKFLDSRNAAFLVRYADTLEKMNDTEF